MFFSEHIKSQLKTLLSEIKGRLPSFLSLPRNPRSELWFYYQFITCTTFLKKRQFKTLSSEIKGRLLLFYLYQQHPWFDFGLLSINNLNTMFKKRQIIIVISYE